MINKSIVDALEPLGVPVSFQIYSGIKTTYITFFCIMDQSGLIADNEEKATEFYIQVDVWSKNDYTELVSNVEDALKGSGFRRISAADLFENDTKIFHKAIRLVTYKEL